MSLTVDDIVNAVGTTDSQKWITPFREQFLSIACVYASSNMLLPSVFAQFAIGAYFGYSRASEIYHAKSEYKNPTPRKAANITVADFVGSPRTSPISALAYYISGTINGKYRVFFLAEELYERVESPAPHLKKNVIDVNKTFIPFCYPNFKYYENKNDSYARCYQAMYESSFARAHQSSTPSSSVYYGEDEEGAFKYQVTHNSLGSFSIRKERKMNFSDNILASITKSYTQEELESQLIASGLRPGLEMNAEKIETFKIFNILGYHSEQQATGASTVYRSLQLSLPEDRLLDPMSDFDDLMDIITTDQPSRIVFHQNQNSAIAQQNALVLASKINRLRLQENSDFRLESLAYHAENPKEAIAHPEHFYSFFSEICTMGYNNPQDIGALTTADPDEEASGKSKLRIHSSESVVDDHQADWDETRVYHIKLQRPPFEWNTVPKTIFAMLVHDFVFEIYGALMESIKSIGSIKSPSDLVERALFVLLAIVSSAKIATQLAMFPVRLIFTACAATYLYYSGKNENLFEIAEKKNFEAALKQDDFAHKTVIEHVLKKKSSMPLIFSATEPPQNEQKAQKKRKRKKKKSSTAEMKAGSK